MTTEGLPDLENLRRQYEAVLNNPYFSHAEKDMALHVLALLRYIERLQEAAGPFVEMAAVIALGADEAPVFRAWKERTAQATITAGDLRALAALLPRRE